MSGSFVDRGKLTNEIPRLDLDYWTLPNRVKFLQFIQGTFFESIQDVPLAVGDDFCEALQRTPVLDISPEVYRKYPKCHECDKKFKINEQEENLKAMVLPCGHSFHVSCIQTKCIGVDRCPACFKQFPHQVFVSNYIQKNSPYRGLLLYHGLGAGKTGSSIAIANGLSTNRKIFVMLPASLHTNYVEEIKKWGQLLYQPDRHWTFVESTRDSDTERKLLEMGFPLKYIRKKKSYPDDDNKIMGVWLIDSSKIGPAPPLGQQVDDGIREQIHTLIKLKYNILHYNDTNYILDRLLKSMPDLGEYTSQVFKKYECNFCRAMDTPVNTSFRSIRELANHKIHEKHDMKNPGDRRCEVFGCDQKIRKKIRTVFVCGDHVETIREEISAAKATSSGIPCPYCKNKIVGEAEKDKKPRKTSPQSRVVLETDEAADDLYDGGTLATVNKVAAAEHPDTLEDQQLLTLVSGKKKNPNIKAFNRHRRKCINRIILSIVGEKEPKIPNPFDNSIVIIDEIHNLISMIVGSGYNGIRIYNLLMAAENMKLVFLSGTPLINYPYEVAVLFNLLSGYTTSYEYQLQKTLRQDEAAELITSIREAVPELDRIEIRRRGLLVTRNPPRFNSLLEADTKRYTGVAQNKRETFEDVLTEQQLITKIEPVVRSYIKRGVDVSDLSNIKVQKYTPFPDILKHLKTSKTNRWSRSGVNAAVQDATGLFNDWFVDEMRNSIKNKSMFKKKIVGFVSFFQRMLGKGLYPDIEKLPMDEVDFSDYQFVQYAEARGQERMLSLKKKLRNRVQKMDPTARRKALVKVNKQEKSEELNKDSQGAYRMLSRQKCNFVFPPEIYRPTKEMEKIGADYSELILLSVQLLLDYHLASASNPSQEEFLELGRLLFPELEHGLDILSPKFAKIIDIITASPGLVFMYSEFRTVEGIGIFSRVLETFGYKRFSIQKNDNGGFEEVEDRRQYPLFEQDIVQVYLNKFDRWFTGRVVAIKTEKYQEPDSDNNEDIMKMTIQNGILQFFDMYQEHHRNILRRRGILERMVVTYRDMVLPILEQGINILNPTFTADVLSARLDVVEEQLALNLQQEKDMGKVTLSSAKEFIAKNILKISLVDFTASLKSNKLSFTQLFTECTKREPLIVVNMLENLGDGSSGGSRRSKSRRSKSPDSVQKSSLDSTVSVSSAASLLDGTQKVVTTPLHNEIGNILVRRTCFALWTGTESVAEKLYIQQTFNDSENKYGMNIKILMATKAGSEGISLFNVRQVHVTEPYWNNMRIEQVIGRAARIQSHKELPLSQRNVVVYQYMAALSEKQKHPTGRQAEFLEDVIVIDGGETSDQALHEISIRKSKTLKTLLHLMMEASIDCPFSTKDLPEFKAEGLQCLTLDGDDDEYITALGLQVQDKDKATKHKRKQSIYDYVPLILPGISIKGTSVNLKVDIRLNQTYKKDKAVLEAFTSGNIRAGKELLKVTKRPKFLYNYYNIKRGTEPVGVMIRGNTYLFPGEKDFVQSLIDRFSDVTEEEVKVQQSKRAADYSRKFVKMIGPWIGKELRSS